MEKLKKLFSSCMFYEYSRVKHVALSPARKQFNILWLLRGGPKESFLWVAFRREIIQPGTAGILSLEFVILERLTLTVDTSTEKYRSSSFADPRLSLHYVFTPDLHLSRNWTRTGWMYE